MCGWLPLACHQLGTWPATQACALTGNQTSDPLVHRLALNPVSHTSQGLIIVFQYNRYPCNPGYFIFCTYKAYPQKVFPDGQGRS